MDLYQIDLWTGKLCPTFDQMRQAPKIFEMVGNKCWLVSCSLLIFLIKQGDIFTSKMQDQNEKPKCHRPLVIQNL